jgi:hypothetical protein
MIRPSFVPPPEFRRLRDVTRYRADLVAARTAEKQRAEKLLEDDLLTEPPSVSAVQVGRALEQAISEMSGRSKLPRPLRCLTSVSATETGHTGLNQSATFSSLPIFDVSCSGS